MEVIWVYGPAGIGKSTTCWELYAQGQKRGIRTGYVDIDQLGMCYPARPADPWREALKAENIGAVLQNFKAANTEVVIVSGILDPSLLPVYHDGASGCRFTFCRLRASHPELRRRIERRGRDQESPEPILREADELDAMDLGHCVIDTDGIGPVQVAQLVAESSGIHAKLDERRAQISPARRPSTATAPRPSAASGYRPTQAPGRALWLCGPTGVGKSTVGYAIFQYILRAGHTAAFVDLEQFGFLYPSPTDDPRNHRLRATNVASVWSAFRSAGASHLIMVGAVENAAQVRFYREALEPTEFTLCRMQASASDLTDRIRRRAEGEGPNLVNDHLINQPPDVLAKALGQALAHDAVLDQTHIDDVRVQTSGETVEDVVHDVLTATDLC